MKLSKTQVLGLGLLIEGDCYIGRKTSGTYLNLGTATALCMKGLATAYHSAKAAERIRITEQGIAEWERQKAQGESS